MGPFKTPSNMIHNNEKANLITSCEYPGIYTENSYFPANCAVQMILNLFFYFYSPTDNQKTPNPACIACKPKYRPTLSSSFITNLTFKYIVSCDLIENC